MRSKAFEIRETSLFVPLDPRTALQRVAALKQVAQAPLEEPRER